METFWGSGIALLDTRQGPTGLVLSRTNGLAIRPAYNEMNPPKLLEKPHWDTANWCFLNETSLAPVYART